MSGRKRILSLILIMAAVSFILVGISVSFLYNTAFREEQGRLVETAQSQARLIEAVARFDALYSRDYPEGPEGATLKQIEDAHKHYKSFGETGEFTLGRLDKDNIVFLLKRRHVEHDNLEPVAFESSIAEPMRRALLGQSGTMVGLDYRGETVLAAYEPVGELNLGIVAKIDLTEVQAPFKRSVLMTLSISVLVILGGVGLFFRISNPMIKRLEKHSAELESRIEERTADLAEANRQLKREIEMRKRSEEVLKIKDKSLSEAQRIAHLGNWDWNISDNVLSWSDETYRIFGLQPQEFGATYDSFINFVHPEDREAVKRAVNKALADPKAPYGIEHRVMRPDGSERTVHERGEVTFDNNGEPIRMIGTVRDITERKQAEELLKKEQEFIQAVLNNIEDGIVACNAEGILTLFNNATRNFHGLPEKPLPSDEWAQYYDLYLPDGKTLMDKEDVPLFKALQGNHIHDIEMVIAPKEGKKRVLLASGQPLFDSDGKKLGAVVSMHDITERKESEQELQEAFSEIRLLKEQLELESNYLREEIKLEHDFENIIGQSDALKYVLYKIEQVASTDTTALILGETGTGKELVARAIHDSSPKKDHPMIKLNCAALPSQLIESELFGHEKGAFTGAHTKQTGRFELANNTTLFLDEIGELPMELQSKLLRVLQDGEFERLGSSRTIKVDVRIIAASNRNLEEEVRNGRFREDLWYRLNVFPITVPPLRDRMEDIPLLVDHFMGKFARKLGKSIKDVPKNVMNALQEYPWPGNIRELENVIERAVINTPGSKLRLADKLDTPHEDLTKASKSLEDIERDYIRRVLEETRWRIDGPKGAAIILGLNASTLHSRMRKLGIQKE